MSSGFIATCGKCQTRYTALTWLRLEYVGVQKVPAGEDGPAYRLELRNCPAPCSSTMSVDPEKLPADDWCCERALLSVEEIDGVRLCSKDDARKLLDVVAVARAAKARIAELQRWLMALEEALRRCARNDKSQYAHHEARPFDGRKPGTREQGGTIWLTPREIARRALGEDWLATLDDPEHPDFKGGQR
jgi:hypothetical protein